MGRTLIIDAATLLYQAYNTTGHLSIQKGPNRGTPTGTSFGFLRSARAWQEKFKADRVLIVWDTPTSQLQKAKDPRGATYKAGRPDNRAVWTNKDQLTRMLDLTKWDQIWSHGYEADDVIIATAEIAAKTSHVTIASADQDLLTAVNATTNLYETGRSNKEKERKLWTQEDVHQTFGTHPRLLPLLWAVTGDAADNIPALRIDSTAALAIKQTLLTATTREEANQEIEATLKATNIPAVLEQYRQNLFLTLPAIPETMEIQEGTKDKAALAHHFTTYEFNSLLNKIDELT